MSLKETISKDFIAAYKAKESDKVSVLRMIQSAIKNAEINSQNELDDTSVSEIIAKQAKQRKDAIVQFEKGDRADLVENEKKELAIINSYLPEQLPEEEVIAIVKNIIKETGATSKADMGKVMGKAMSELKGKADGSLISKIVSQNLA